MSTAHCCGAPRSALELSPTLTAATVGGYSLAGVQVKFAATSGATLTCTNCGWSAHGHVEYPVIEDGKFVSGNFVVHDGPLA